MSFCSSSYKCKIGGDDRVIGDKDSFESASIFRGNPYDSVDITLEDLLRRLGIKLIDPVFG